MSAYQKGREISDKQPMSNLQDQEQKKKNRRKKN